MQLAPHLGRVALLDTSAEDLDVLGALLKLQLDRTTPVLRKSVYAIYNTRAVLLLLPLAGLSGLTAYAATRALEMLRFSCTGLARILAATVERCMHGRSPGEAREGDAWCGNPISVSIAAMSTRILQHRNRSDHTPMCTYGAQRLAASPLTRSLRTAESKAYGIVSGSSISAPG